MQGSIGSYLHGKLAAAILLAATIPAAAAGAQAQSAARQHHPDSIVGTWLLTVKPSDGPAFMQIENYAPNGTISAIDNFSASSLETPSVGPWRKVGPRKYYEDDYQFTYNPDGSFAGTFVVHAEDDLNETGTKILPGRYTYEVLDASGNVIDSGWGTASAVRVPAPRGPKP